MRRVMNAINFAAMWHEKKNQRRFGNVEGGLPYIVHPAAVASVAMNFGYGNDEDFIAACWCHDVLEDTDAPWNDLVKAIGLDASLLVKIVTNPKIGSRVEKHAIQYPIIAQSDAGIALKYCDRIANIMSGGKLGMYKKEEESFQKMFYKDKGYFDKRILSMQDCMDKLLIDVT